MKIILLYGPGEVSKRLQLQKIKGEFDPDSISVVDLKDGNLNRLTVEINSYSLFGQRRQLIIAENVSDKLDIQKLTSTRDDLTVLIISSAVKENSLLLSSAKKAGAKILSFDGEKEVLAFPYLDYLIEGKSQAYVELEKLLQQYGGVYVLSMIYYLLRRNILPQNGASFMKNKIFKQKRRFSDSDWEKMYYLVLDTEFKIKSGLIFEKTALVELSAKIMGRHF